MLRYLTKFLATFLLFLSANIQAEAFTGTPADICQWMKSEKFAGGNNYEKAKGEIYQCTTLRKTMIQGEPAKSDIRYLAQGTESAVNQVRLEMMMRSFRQPQQTLRKFQEYANTLSNKALGSDLPEDISNTIRSGVIGEWPLSGKTIKLEKLHQAGSSYELHFSIL